MLCELYKKYLLRLILCMLLLDLSVFLAKAEWVPTNGPGGGDITAISINGGNIFAGTADGIFLSTNNGTNWTTINFSHEASAIAVNGGNIFAGTRNGGVSLTTNNGTSWIPVGPRNTDVLSLAVSDNTIFAGTPTGVWRRPLSEMVGISKNEPKREKLKQINMSMLAEIYVNPNVTVVFNLPFSNQVAINIINLSGKAIASLVNKNLGPGSYSFLWNTRNIALGCYRVKMQIGQYTFTKSIPLLR